MKKKRKKIQVKTNDIFSKPFNHTDVILMILPTACRQSFSGGARISIAEVLRDYPQDDGWGRRILRDYPQNDSEATNDLES